MKFGERIEKIKLFFNIEKEMKMQALQLEEMREKIIENKNELKKIEEEVSKKKDRITIIKN